MSSREVEILLGMIVFIFGLAAGIILQSWRVTYRTAPGSAEQDRPFGRTVTLEAAEPLSKGQMVYLDSTGRAVGKMEAPTKTAQCQHCSSEFNYTRASVCTSHGGWRFPTVCYVTCPVCRGGVKVAGG